MKEVFQALAERASRRMQVALSQNVVVTDREGEKVLCESRFCDLINYFFICQFFLVFLQHENKSYLQGPQGCGREYYLIAR